LRNYLNFGKLQNLLFAILVLMSVLFLSCNKQKVLTKKHAKQHLIQKYSSYPWWFWNMPQSRNAVFAVGYAQTSLYPESHREKAIENGIRNLAKSLTLKIQGERGLIYTILSSEFRSGDFQEILPKETLDFVSKNHQIIATETFEDMTIVLLCIGSSQPVSSVKGFSFEEPNWISNPPQRSGYLYAVGEYSLQYNEENSWQFAEYNARTNLVWTLFSKLKTFVKKFESFLDGTIAVKTDIFLNKIQVEKRWVDTKNNDFYALVRMRLRDNTKSFIDQFRKIFTPRDNYRNKSSREEIIRKLFEEMNNFD